jgi:hypothetical protein
LNNTVETFLDSKISTISHIDLIQKNADEILKIKNEVTDSTTGAIALLTDADTSMHARLNQAKDSIKIHETLTFNQADAIDERITNPTDGLFKHIANADDSLDTTATTFKTAMETIIASTETTIKNRITAIDTATLSNIVAHGDDAFNAVDSEDTTLSANATASDTFTNNSINTIDGLIKADVTAMDTALDSKYDAVIAKETLMDTK